MTVARALTIHLLTSLALVALTFNAVAQPWITMASGEPVVASLVTKWLPYALFLANVAAALVVAALPPAARARFLVRHAALYLVVPLLLLFLRASGGLVPGQAGVLYAALLAAVSVHLLKGMWDALPVRGDRTVAALLGAVALAVFLALLPYHRAVMPTASDEPHYLVIVQSLLDDADLDLRDEYESESYRSYYPARLPDMHGIEIGRAVYPIRDLGLPLVSAVPFAVGGRSGVLAVMCVIGALLAVQLFLLLRDLGFRRENAFLAAALASFTHPLLTYTTQIYPELAVALLFVTVARLVRGGRATPAISLALASGLAALMPLCSTRAWLIAAPVALVIGLFAILAPLGLRARLGRALAAGLPFLAIVGAITVANGAMFGVFLPSAGYYIIRDQQQVLAYTPHVGGLGLLFDRVFGLLGRAPIFLLAFLGLGALWLRRRTHGALLLVLAAGFGAYFAYISSIAYWWADGSPPSRYLLGAIPFLVVALAGGLEVLERVRAGLRVGAVAVLGWASAFVTFVYAVLPNLRYDLALEIRARGGSGQLWDHLGRVIRPEPGDALPSLVTLDPASVALAAAWSLLAVLLVVAGVRLSRDGAPSRPIT